jgi:hypothetical protein
MEFFWGAVIVVLGIAGIVLSMNAQSDRETARQAIPDYVATQSYGNPPIKEYQPEVEFSRNLPRGGSLEEIAIYRQPDFGRSQAG